MEYWEQDPATSPTTTRTRLSSTRAQGPPPRAAAGAKDLGVQVEAQFSVGEYDIVILSAKDASGLDVAPPGRSTPFPRAPAFFRPYVQNGSKFFVAKIDASKVMFQNGVAQLSPLRFHYDSRASRFRCGSGSLERQGAAGPHRARAGPRPALYEVTNYPNVAVPTNFDVNDNVRGNFGSFYAALFDETLKRHPKSVVTVLLGRYLRPAPRARDVPARHDDPGRRRAEGAAQTPQATVLGPGGPMPMPRRGRGSMSMASRSRDCMHDTRKTTWATLPALSRGSAIVGGREHIQADGKPEQGPPGLHQQQLPGALRDPSPVDGTGGLPESPARHLGLTPANYNADARRRSAWPLPSAACRSPTSSQRRSPARTSCPSPSPRRADRWSRPRPTRARHARRRVDLRRAARAARGSRGCGGCNTGGPGEGALAAGLGLAVVAVLRARKRR